VEELNAAGNVATEKISRFKADLDHEAIVRSSGERELEQEQLRGELEGKGSEMLKRDSELQQKGSAMQTAQQELEEMRQRAEGVVVTLMSECATFEEAKECLDDLNRVLIAQDEAEVREQMTMDHCQRAVKVFKFKKYKRGTKTGNKVRPRGTRLRLEPS